MYSTIKSFIINQPYLKKIVLPIWNFYKNKKSKKIFKRLIKERESINIVVGASGVFDSNWIPSDIGYLNILDDNDWSTYFKPDSIDAILSEHVWEHLTTQEGEKAVASCHKYLKPNAYMRIAVPDGYHPDKEYIDAVKAGGSGDGALDHKVLYTYKSLSAILEEAGFVVNILEYFDENGKFHQKNWDANKGMIHRSANHDKRNENGMHKYTSIIIDARKL